MVFQCQQDDLNVKHFSCISEALTELHPSLPLYCYHPEKLIKTCQIFQNNFIGDILYAVKANPDEIILHHLYQQGISQFDVASIAEIELLSQFFIGKKITLYFMNPIKTESSIRQAYVNYGVRHFALDDEQELVKIIRATDQAEDLILFIRIKLAHSQAKINLSTKFGCHLSDAKNLLKQCKKYANRVGICFHVGSQNFHIEDYYSTLEKLQPLFKLNIDFVDIGGGFPVNYSTECSFDLATMLKKIINYWHHLPNTQAIQLMIEPGRAMVAESVSLLTRIEMVKTGRIYVNESIYGGLFEAKCEQFCYPMQIYRHTIALKMASQQLQKTLIFGVSCDSYDVLDRPYLLPKNLQIGDYLEIKKLGAYSWVFKPVFNGFQGFEKCLIHASSSW